jgi:hypothetical protein
VPQTVIGSLLIILIGLAAVWHGLRVMRASRSYVPPDPGPAPQSLSSRLDARMQPRRPSSRLEMRLTGLAFLAMGLSMVGYSVTNLRYLRSHHIVVPPSAPLPDQIIWLLTLACLGSFLVLAAMSGVVRYLETRRARR